MMEAIGSRWILARVATHNSCRRSTATRAWRLPSRMAGFRISSAACAINAGGSWLAVRWPFSDMGMGLVAFGMNTIQRVSADEYWTIGLTGTSQSVLLYFANGAWHEYGQ